MPVGRGFGMPRKAVVEIERGDAGKVQVVLAMHLDEFLVKAQRCRARCQSKDTFRITVAIRGARRLHLPE